MTKHIEWETLNDYIDEPTPLDAVTRQATGDHLLQCAECRESLARLRSLLAGAADIVDVAPPPEAWSAVSDTIARRKSVSLADRLPAAVPDSGHRGRSWRVWLSAAVIMLVASSLLFRYSDRAKAIATGGTPDTTPVVAAATTELQRIEREYGTTADALSEAMKEPRVHQNAPDVAESLARSVAVIDAAIAEAREDLIKDPSSDFARQALVRNYQQKIDLLRRVTARAVSN